MLRILLLSFLLIQNVNANNIDGMMIHKECELKTVKDDLYLGKFRIGIEYHFECKTGALICFQKENAKCIDKRKQDAIKFLKNDNTKYEVHLHDETWRLSTNTTGETHWACYYFKNQSNNEIYNNVSNECEP